MSIANILIILGVVGAVIVIASTLILSRNKKKKKEKKSEAPKIEKPKEEKPKDDSFKVSKRDRVVKISKKALESDSRTAKIERVYEKQIEPPQESVNIEMPYPVDENLEKNIESVQTDKKIVSLGELQQTFEEEQKQAEEEKLKEMQKPARKSALYKRKYTSIADYHNDYSKTYYGGHSVGNSTLKPSVNLTKNYNEDHESQQRNADTRRTFDNFGLRAQILGQPQVTKKETDDYNSMIETEAILNPKFKKKKGGK